MLGPEYGSAEVIRMLVIWRVALEVGEGRRASWEEGKEPAQHCGREGVRGADPCKWLSRAKLSTIRYEVLFFCIFSL